MNDRDARTARRGFVVLTGLRWLRVGPIAAVLVVLLQHHGMTLSEVGAAFAAYGVATFLLEVPTGSLADTLGTRPVLVMAIAVDAVGTVVLLVGGPVWMLLGAAAMLGCGRALASGPLEAWYVVQARAANPEADIRTGLSRAGVAESLALGAGALIGGYGGRLAAEPLGLAPLQVPVVVSLAAHVVFAVAVVRLVAARPLGPLDPRGLRARTAQEVRQVPVLVTETLRTVRGSTELARLLGVAVAAAVPLVVTEVLWQPAVVHHAGVDSARTDLLGLLGAAIFVAAAVGAWLAPRIGRWFGDRMGRAVTVLVVTQSFGVVALGLVPNLPVFALVLVTVYLVGGAWFPLQQELIHDRVGDGRRATVLSTMSLGMQGGNVATQATLIPLAAATSRAASWAIAAGVAVLGALGVVRLRTRPGMARGPAPDPGRAITPPPAAARTPPGGV